MIDTFDLIDQIFDWKDDDHRSTVDPVDEVLIFGSRRPPGFGRDLLINQYFTGLMAASHPLVGPAIRESRLRTPSLRPLLFMNRRQQRRAVRRPPYRDLVVANGLLDECNKIARDRPEEAERCAVLAEWIANQPWPDEPERAATVLLNALLCQAKVHHLHGDWKKAELRFAAAYGLLRGRVTHDAHSTFCRKLSQLRADQGRYDEAILLKIYEMQIDCALWGLDQPRAHWLCGLAVLALKQNDPGRALSILTRLVLDQESDPAFESVDREVDVFRAICMAAIGDADTARRLMAETQPEWRLIIDRKKVIAFEWLECRIATHLGDLDRAIPRLEAIRRWLFSEGGHLAEICLISIDLALAHAKRGQAAERLPGLLSDIAEILEAGEKPWALGSLGRFREALEHGQDPAAAAREAAEIVHRREMPRKRLAARGYRSRP
jgi:tetratricopeptide (TPR) repeat protein